VRGVERLERTGEGTLGGVERTGEGAKMGKEEQEQTGGGRKEARGRKKGFQ
jgi:hypothetical protein